MVDKQLATQVGLLLKTLYEELVGTTIELPVDILRRLAAIIQSMLGKFYRETMERAFVQTRDESLYNLPSKEI